MKKKIEVTVFNATKSDFNKDGDFNLNKYDYDIQWPPISLDGFSEWLSVVKYYIPDEYHENATISIDCESDFSGCASTRIIASYWKHETKKGEFAPGPRPYGLGAYMRDKLIASEIPESEKRRLIFGPDVPETLPVPKHLLQPEAKTKKPARKRAVKK